MPRWPRWLAGAVGLALYAHSLAAPYIPASDAEVVEVLPSRQDPAVQRVESLRQQLAARPDDAELRLDIARRYFDLAMAQGDPRYVGYATQALQGLGQRAQPPAGYWLLQGMLQQYRHEFDAALASLEKAAQAAPWDGEPHAWRAAIYMVQARYPEAARACKDLSSLAPALIGTGCTAYVQGTAGELAAAYASLEKALAAAPQASAELRVWQLTRLGEMAIRLGQSEAANRHFQQALGLGVTDQFLLGAYADWLLEQQRPQDALRLLQGWERSDILLLRLALAAKAAGDGRAAAWTRTLRERLDAAAQRGDRLHEQEAARFELDLAGNKTRALALARDNYSVQKEPRDAQMLLRAALAARDPEAARPALDWLQSSRHEDPRLARLAADLAALPARSRQP